MRRLLLIRHAERPIILDNEIGNDVLLTQKGRESSLKFAMSLNEPLVSVISSPIIRCVHTAQIIAKIKSYPIDQIKIDTDLGDPGFIIEDGALAWEHWQKKGHKLVNEYLLAGEEHWAGFTDLKVSVPMFNKKINSFLLNMPKGLHLWVTHDTILAAFASRILEDTLRLSDWPDYLGYLEISMNNKGRLEYMYSQQNSFIS